MSKKRNDKWTPLKFVEFMDEWQTEVHTNRTHTVLVRPCDSTATDHSGWLSISFRRNDRKPECDWRIMQRIKNEIAGLEREAVQLFPANSRVVDTSNQYHLWVAPVGEQFPLGYDESDVLTPEELKQQEDGAVQREFDDDDPALNNERVDRTRKNTAFRNPKVGALPKQRRGGKRRRFRIHKNDGIVQ
tara:strand:- start:768 stop:1331 length:564 start_codon:yes stop_codon:yes gene_type:complete